MIDCSKAKNYLNEKKRMTCTTLELQQPETAIKIVQEWSDDNSQKTYLSEFLQNYPNAELEKMGSLTRFVHML